ncbi:hypothetical protein [Vibrio fluvialis]|uniref:hypothetical protein n=1 Tax=Vibrio fluvialis TaxID=676 RepID=UPI003D7E6357
MRDGQHSWKAIILIYIAFIITYALALLSDILTGSNLTNWPNENPVVAITLTMALFALGPPAIDLKNKFYPFVCYKIEKDRLVLLNNSETIEVVEAIYFMEGRRLCPLKWRRCLAGIDVISNDLKLSQRQKVSIKIPERMMATIKGRSRTVIILQTTIGAIRARKLDCNWEPKGEYEKFSI